MGLSVKDLARLLDAPLEWVEQWEKSELEISEYFAEEIKNLCAKTDQTVFEVVRRDLEHIILRSDFYRYPEMPRSWRQLVAYRAKMQRRDMGIYNSRTEMSAQWQRDNPVPTDV